MSRQKDTAHRPSESHKKFVYRKDGTKVRNTAYIRSSGRAITTGSGHTDLISDFHNEDQPISDADIEDLYNTYSSLMDEIQFAQFNIEDEEMIQAHHIPDLITMMHDLNRSEELCEEMQNEGMRDISIIHTEDASGAETYQMDFTDEYRRAAQLSITEDSENDRVEASYTLSNHRQLNRDTSTFENGELVYSQKEVIQNELDTDDYYHSSIDTFDKNKTQGWVKSSIYKSIEDGEESLSETYTYDDRTEFILTENGKTNKETKFPNGEYIKEAHLGAPNDSQSSSPVVVRQSLPGGVDTEMRLTSPELYRDFPRDESGDYLPVARMESVHDYLPENRYDTLNTIVYERNPGMGTVTATCWDTHETIYVEYGLDTIEEDGQNKVVIRPTRRQSSINNEWVEL